jgi:hypothetical protein
LHLAAISGWRADGRKRLKNVKQRIIDKQYIPAQILPVEWNRGAIMKKLAVLFQTALFMAIVSFAYSQSLADLAKEEQERRQGIQNDRVITEEEAAKFRSDTVTTNGSDQTAPKPDQAKKPALGTEATAASDEPTDFQGRTESYWRKTMGDARQRVKDLENEANVIILKLNTLQNQFYNLDDGFKREGIQRDIQKSLYEQDKNKEDLTKAQDILQDLEKEARKSGALPGWVNK